MLCKGVSNLAPPSGPRAPEYLRRVLIWYHFVGKRTFIYHRNECPEPITG